MNVHWQLEDKTLACGAPHWNARSVIGDPVCCKREPGWAELPVFLRCTACLQVARIAGLAA